ncbi:MAG TPA: carbon-nitrogen hydrolase family protein [Anaerolineae bacterium]|nr:carbon-nitrogen hydrolase family protein [Anaerolineae bacterium]HQH38066.1 carbon-nitrogen hydrolase family protein [Anaerolineae bacterium]
MQRFTAACAQFAVKPLAVRENIEKALAWTERAAQETGARLVVLPETVTTGFTPDCSVEELWSQVDTLPGPLTAPVAAAARALDLYVVFPTYERGPAPDIVYNSAALFGPEGLLGVYRKTHLFPTERRAAGGWSTPGVAPVVVQTPLATLGLTICYDGDFPELYRCEAVRGAEVIVRPAALLRSFEIWEVTNKARAYDNHVYIVACNAIGPDAGGNYYFGHSMIVSPIAQTLALGRGTEDIIAVELDPEPLKHISYGSTGPMIFDHLEDRNLAAYGDVLMPARSRFAPAWRVPQEPGGCDG